MAINLVKDCLRQQQCTQFVQIIRKFLYQVKSAKKKKNLKKSGVLKKPKDKN